MPRVVWRRGPRKDSTGPAGWARLWKVASLILPGSITLDLRDPRREGVAKVSSFDTLSYAYI